MGQSVRGFMKKSILRLTILLAVVFALPVSGVAIPISGTGSYGSFTGEMTYNGGLLNIYLRNTSPEVNGGYITAFVFNNPGNLALTGFEYIGPEGSSFYARSADNGINGPPYGRFDFLASTENRDNGFEGPGNPAAGIPVNSYASFTFQFSGANLADLTAESFLNAYSTTGAASLVVRFTGFDGGQSDKVPHSVPEPGMIILLGVGLLGIGLSTKRKF